MKEKLARFMSGRYGVDQLSRLYLGIALILLVVSIFSHLGIFYIAGIVFWCILIIVCFRRHFQDVCTESEVFECKISCGGKKGCMEETVAAA